MKKLFFTLVFLASIFGNAQEKTEENLLKNELHFNALLPIAFKSFEVSYERNLNESSSLGVSALIANEDYYFTKYALTPYYRKYFSNGYAKGFFIEGFAMLNGGENQYAYDYEDSDIDEHYTDVALGIGLGGKFITKDHFVATINLGVGRNMGNELHEEFVLKGGISLGYRF